MSGKEVAMSLEKISSLLAAAIPTAHINLLFEENANEDHRYDVQRRIFHLTSSIVVSFLLPMFT